MDKNVRRSPIGRRDVHRAVPPLATRANTSPAGIGRASLADLQSDAPAHNDTGVPKTPSEMSTLEPAEDGKHSKDDEGEERGAVMDWFDRLGE